MLRKDPRESPRENGIHCERNNIQVRHWDSLNDVVPTGVITGRCRTVRLNQSQSTNLKIVVGDTLFPVLLLKRVAVPQTYYLINHLVCQTPRKLLTIADRRHYFWVRRGKTLS